MIKSLRLQLALWYLAFFSALALLFCVGLYTVVSRTLQNHLDANLTTEAGTASKLLKEELDEARGNGKQAAGEVLDTVDPQSSIVAIFDESGLLGASRNAALPGLQSTAAKIIEGSADSIRTVPALGKNGARVAARRFTAFGHTFAVLSVASLDSNAQGLKLLRNAMWLTIPPLLLLAGLGGYLLTRRSLSPLGTMVEQSSRITGENLHTRLVIGNAAQELTTLAASFNEVLSRLDQSFETMRRFVQDASHELRTPLAVIRGEADVALLQDRSLAEYRESLATIQEESRRLSRLVEDLLNLARADAGRVQIRSEELYLNDLLADCCRSLRALAGPREVRIECHAPDDVVVKGDEDLLRRMVLNLLDNAIRYTPPGGQVLASLEVQGPEVRIRVADTGVGITSDAAPHVFERFYRADAARSRDEGGFGLGLSIVKWIAESHRGTVELESQPGEGSRFTVLLRR